MGIIKWHPGAGMHVAFELTIGNLGPERKQEVAETPIGAVGTGRAIAGVLRSPGRISEMIFGGTAGNGVAQRFVFGDIIDIDMAGMQEAEMRGVDFAFERLQIVAVALNETHADLTIRNIQDFEGR